MTQGRVVSSFMWEKDAWGFLVENLWGGKAGCGLVGTVLGWDSGGMGSSGRLLGLFLGFTLLRTGGWMIFARCLSYHVFNARSVHQVLSVQLNRGSAWNSWRCLVKRSLLAGQVSLPFPPHLSLLAAWLMSVTLSCLSIQRCHEHSE